MCIFLGLLKVTSFLCLKIKLPQFIILLYYFNFREQVKGTILFDTLPRILMNCIPLDSHMAPWGRGATVEKISWGLAKNFQVKHEKWI